MNLKEFNSVIDNMNVIDKIIYDLYYCDNDFRKISKIYAKISKGIKLNKSEKILLSRYKEFIQK